jgi:transposase
VIDMELLSVIRRWRYRDYHSIREISRRTGLSRNTVRKYLRSDSIEPRFNIPDRPSKLDPYADKLSHMLRQEAGKSRKQKRTVKQLHADLTALGYDGSYNRVAAFAREWKAARQREQQTCGRGAFVPLAFLPGEAFQFDWSEDWAVIGGERTKLQVAHFKLCYSRAFILRAYPQQTHEMLFDAHNHAFRVLGGVPRRGIYDNLWTSPAQGDLLGSAAGMHESIRPVAGRIAPLALMGVRCFWPHNMIGHEGLVVDQAWKFAVLADEPSGVTSHPNLASASALARCDHAAAI